MPYRTPPPSPQGEPFAAVLGLGDRAAALGSVLATVGTLAVHGGFVATGTVAMLDLGIFARNVQADLAEELRSEYDVEFEEEQPEPEPEVEEPEPEPEEPEPEIDDPQPLPEPDPSEPPAPPEPAEVGQALTAEPDPDEPVDMTGDAWSMVTGKGEYRGGTSSNKGKAKKAVRSRTARPGSKGKAGGTGKAVRSKKPRGKSKRRQPVPVQAAWNCGFPPEAELEQVNQALVRISVVVAKNGRPRSVSVLNDPGYGFGRLARQCAMRKTYRPALDDAGRPAVGTVSFGVRFRRR